MSEIPVEDIQEESKIQRRRELAANLRKGSQPMLLTLALLVVFFIIGMGTGYLVWGQPLNELSSQVESLQARADAAESLLQQLGVTTQNESPAAQDADGIRQVVRYPVTEDGNPSIGPQDAPITIIEFSDYECPFCTRWHVEVWSRLKTDYGDKVRLVHRDFPLYSIHPNAGPAAAAAYCAQEQDRYWEFHELLFTGGQPLGNTTYLAYADQLGLDMASFSDCLDEQRYKHLVDANFEYARQLGIQSTPTFFINGIALIGAQPYEVFKEVIDLELAGKLSK